MTTYISCSPEETRKIAEKFAHGLKGDECIALIGEMGVGKTVFVQGLGSALGEDEVTSPTFSLMNAYDQFYHFDLYRLTAEGVLQDGMDEYFYDKARIKVIEWPVIELLPPEHIEVKIEVMEENKRRITIERQK